MKILVIEIQANQLKRKIRKKIKQRIKGIVRKGNQIQHVKNIKRRIKTSTRKRRINITKRIKIRRINRQLNVVRVNSKEVTQVQKKILMKLKVIIGQLVMEEWIMEIQYNYLMILICGEIICHKNFMILITQIAL